MADKKIILPPEGMKVERTDVDGLWHPQGERPEPGYMCLICGQHWPQNHRQSYIQHVPQCSAVNENVLREASLRVKDPDMFDPQQAGDVEYRKWLKNPVNVGKEFKGVKKRS